MARGRGPALLPPNAIFGFCLPTRRNLGIAVCRSWPMFREAMPIAYDAPAELKKWPSVGNQRLNGGRQPYLVHNGTLAECIRLLMAKPIKQICLYDIVTPP